MRKFILPLVLLGMLCFSFNLKAQYFTEDFENGGAFPGGWVLSPGSGNDWAIDNGTDFGPGAAHSGTYCAFFNDYDYTSGTSARMTTPLIDFSAATAPELKFWYYDAGGSDVVQVLVSTDSINFTVVYTTAATVTPWTQIAVDLTAYAGNDSIYISFKGTSVWGLNNPHIDDIIVAEMPTDAVDWCNLQWPATISIYEGGKDTAYAQIYEPGLTETGGQGAGVEVWIGYSTSGSDPSTWSNWIVATYNTDVANNDEYMATLGVGLIPGTYYYASRVRLNGGPYKYGGYNAGFWDGATSLSGVLTVNENVVSAFPWCEGFEGTTFFETIGWSRVNNNADADQWTQNTTATYAHTGTKSARLYTDLNAANDDWLITPAITLTGNQQLGFWIRARSVTEPEEIQVLLSTTDKNLASFSEVLMASTPVNYITFNEIQLDLSAYTGNVYIAFVRNQAPADGFYLYLDDVCLTEIPSCPNPSALTATNITAGSVDLSWTTGGAINWNIEWGPTGFTPGTGTFVTDATNPYTLTGLSELTGYSFYVQDSCGTGDVSVWVGPFTFTTMAACNAPANLTASNITDMSADLEWDGFTATNWDIEIGTTGFTPTGSPTYNDVTVIPQGASGLNPETSYEFYVRADCGTDSSAWIGPFEFTTTMSPLTNPSACGLGLTFPFTETEYEIDVTGVAGTVLGTDIKVTDVNFIVEHTWDADVEISLISPNGVEVPLTIGNGGGGDNYGVPGASCTEFTNLNMSGANGLVSAGVAPFNGSFIPDGDFVDFNDGTDPNGIWKVKLFDNYASLDDGTLEYFEIAFSPTSAENDILTYSFAVETGTAVINNINHTVNIEVDYGTDPSALVATFTLSDFANAEILGVPQVSGVTANDFINPVTYSVIAENATTQDWVVTVSVRAPYTDTDILTFSIAEQTGPATISDVNHTVDIEVGFGTDVTALVADFTLSLNANADVATTPQVSGVTANDFTGAVTYTVTAEDGTTSQDWLVTVTVMATQNTETDILTYSIAEETSPAVINDVNHTVDLTVGWTVDVTGLTADFTLSFGAGATVLAATQVSGVTANDFTNPVTYTVLAEDGTTFQDWVVTVTLEPAPAGAYCDDPIVVGSLPYAETATNTAEFGDFYSTSPCNANYMTGDEVIYTYTPASDVFVNINIFNIVNNWTGVHVLDSCPDLADSCYAFASTGSTTDDLLISELALTGGTTYFIVVSTYTTPQSTTFDLLIEEVSCPSPTNVTVDSTATTTANISWTEAGSATAWNIEYGPAGFTPGTGIILEGVAENPYEFIGLVEATDYEFYIASLCGIGDTSEWVGPIVFSTGCGPITTFTYTENFDGGWDCWQVVNNDGDANLWSQSAVYLTPHSGAFTAHGMGNQDDYLISPKFTLPADMELKWWDVVESATRNNTYDVLVSTTTSDIASFTDNLGTFNCTNIAWLEHVIDLSAYSGQNIYIAFHQIYSASTIWGFGIDDFSVSQKPSCPSPTALSVTNITNNSAQLSWTTGGAANWNIEYGPAGFTPGTGTFVYDVTNPYTLTGLTSSTNYAFYVQDSCDVGNVSLWTGQFAFLTSCDVFTAPFIEEFSTATQPTCWSNFSSSMAANELWKFAGTGDYGALANGKPNGTYAWVDGSVPNTATNVTLLTPWIDISVLSVPKLSFQIFSNNTNNPGDNMTMDVDINDGTGWTNLYTHSEDNAAWQNFEFFLMDYVNDTVQVRFVVDQTTAIVPYYNDILIDSVVIDQGPSCPDPIALGIDNLTDVSVDLMWSSVIATNWLIEWDTAGFVSGTGTTVITYNNPYSLTGLVAETTYEFYVMDSCGVADVSAWVGPFSFTTTAACPLPANLGASNITDMSADLVWQGFGGTNWDIELGITGFSQIGIPTFDDVTAIPYNVTTLIPSTTYDYYVRADCGTDSSAWAGPYTFTTPACNLVDQCYYTLLMGDSYGDGWNGNQLSVYQDGYLAGNFTLLNGLSGIDSVALCPGAAIDFVWTVGSFPTEPSLTVLYPYGDTVVSFASGSAPGAGSFYSFNAYCTAPTCPVPTQLGVENLVDISADLVWTTGGATHWNIEWGPVGFVPGTGTMVADASNPYSVSGLTAETSYSFYVQDSCGTDDLSLWAGPFTFTTTGTCPVPSNLDANNITDISANLIWNGYFASMWDIEVGLAGFTPTGVPTENDVITDQYTVTGLSAETDYQYYVRADCSPDSSSWAGPFAFTTLMSPFTNPSDCALGFTLPDNSCIDLPVAVNVSGNNLGGNVVFTDMNVIIQHTWDSDVTLRLISPSGVSVELTSGNGSSGDNYGIFDSTCVQYTNFNMTGANGSITSGVAPFAGSYIPEGNFANFNDGSDPNGIWILQYCDVAGGDIGILQYVELGFDVVTADIAIINPQDSAYYERCDLTDQDTVIMVISNVGDTLVSAGDSILCSYLVNGTTLIEEPLVLSANFYPGENIVFQFAQTFDFSAVGTYDIQLGIMNLSDMDNINDIVSITVEQASYVLDLDALNNGVMDTLVVNPYPTTLDAGAGSQYYFWSTIENTQTIQVSADGWYICEIYNNSGCYGIDSIYVTLGVGMDDVASKIATVNVFPNPSRDFFNLDINLSNADKISIEIVNAQGQMVYSEEVPKTLIYKQKIDVVDFASGVYYLKVTSGELNRIEKIVVQ